MAVAKHRISCFSHERSWESRYTLVDQKVYRVAYGRRGRQRSNHSAPLRLLWACFGNAGRHAT